MRVTQDNFWPLLSSHADPVLTMLNVYFNRIPSSCRLDTCEQRAVGSRLGWHKALIYYASKCILTMIASQIGKDGYVFGEAFHY